MSFNILFGFCFFTHRLLLFLAHLIHSTVCINLCNTFCNIHFRSVCAYVTFAQIDSCKWVCICLSISSVYSLTVYALSLSLLLRLRKVYCLIRTSSLFIRFMSSSLCHALSRNHMHAFKICSTNLFSAFPLYFLFVILVYGVHFRSRSKIKHIQTK